MCFTHWIIGFPSHTLQSGGSVYCNYPIVQAAAIGRKLKVAIITPIAHCPNNHTHSSLPILGNSRVRPSNNRQEALASTITNYLHLAGFGNMESNIYGEKWLRKINYNVQIFNIYCEEQLYSVRLRIFHFWWFDQVCLPPNQTARDFRNALGTVKHWVPLKAA